MDKKKLTRIEILSMIEEKKITAEEGLKLLKGKAPHNSVSLQNTPSTTKTYNFRWEKKDLVPTESENLSQYIVLFDYSDELRKLIIANYGVDPSHVIFVKPAKSFKKVDDHNFELNPSDKGDYKLLFEGLVKLDMAPSKIVHRLSKEQFSPTEAVIKAQIEAGFYSLLYISQTLMELKIKNKLDLIHMYDAPKGLEPLYAAISGFVKTIRMENPNYKYRTIALKSGNATFSPDRIANIIVKELESKGDETEICYDQDIRFVKEYQEVQLNDLPEQSVIFRPQGTYLITGGTGGVGMILARYLAANFKANIILAGSSEINESKNKAIEELKGLGAKAIYLRDDLSKRSDTKKLIEKAREHFGEINGILHCAGFIKDALLVNKKEKEIERVFGPKIYGSVFLSEMLKSNPADFMVFFSGMASVMGNVGQVDYSFANAFLDNFAWLLSDSLPHTKVVSINWPFWENGGMKMDDQKKEWLKETHGIVPLGDEHGVKALLKALNASFPQIMVVQTDSERKGLVNSIMNEQKLSTPKPQTASALPGNELHNKTEEYLKNIISKQLKLAPSKIVSSEPLERYGIDSMSIVRMTSEMEKDFGELSKTLFFEYQNVNELTQYFIGNYKDTITVKFGNSSLNDEVKKSVASAEKPKSNESKVLGTNRFMAQTLKAQTTYEEDIAIIGVSGRYPLAQNLEEYWENLKSGKDCITEIPSDRWNYNDYYSPERGRKDKIYSKWGGFIDDYDKFDPLFFSIPPRDAEIIDPQERLFLEVTWQTVEDAGYTITELNKYEVGVYVGVMYGHYQLFGAEETARGNTMALSSSYSSIANRISYTFDFHGPSIALDTMCSSSLTTIHLACESIRRGECQLAVAGGVNLTIHPTKHLFLSANNFASSDGKCRSFGEGGDGYVPGEGVGAILLKSLNQAQADGDHIYAVIKASSINHDGKTNGYTVPNPNSQSDLILKALKKANLNPRAVSYIEAHGTGTSLGDPIEITGLTKAFTKYTQDKQFCSIGSVKSNIGHAEAAAGVAGVTKILLQMKHRQLVPSIHSDTLNPNIRFENTPFYVQRSCTEWKQPVVDIDGKETKFPRIAGISSFGAGGSNAHIILAEYIDNQPAVVNPSIRPQVVILSARNEDRLKAYAKKLLNYIEKSYQTVEEHSENSGNILLQVQEEIRQMAADILQVGSGDLEMDNAFSELNLGMVEITAFIDRINAKFETNLTLQNALDNPSLGSVASYLYKQHETLMKRHYPELTKHEVVTKSEASLNLDELAYTLQTGREAKEERVAIVASDINELKQKLDEFCQDKKDLEGVYIGNINKSKSLFDEKSSAEYANILIKNREYSNLAQLWISGVKIDWNQLYINRKPRRISLPTYPFDAKRYWYNSFQKNASKEVKTQKPNNIITTHAEKSPKVVNGFEKPLDYSDAEKTYKGNEVSLQIIDESIALITLHDEKHRNMFSDNVVLGLMAKFAEVQRNENIKSIVITGYDNIFCMGGTREQLLGIADQKNSFTDVPFLYRGLLECPIPVITAIQGHASGGGLLFGLNGDIILMAEEGIYTAVFTKYGFTPGMGATYILKQKFGHNLAMEMMYTAKSYTGDELHQKGAQVTFKKSKDVLKEALKIAKSLSEKPLITLKTLKKELSSRILEELPGYIERENFMHLQTFTKPEVKERINHFYLNGHEFKTQSEIHSNVANSSSSKIRLDTVENFRPSDNSKNLATGSKQPVSDLKDLLEALESGKMSPDEALQFRQKINNK